MAELENGSERKYDILPGVKLPDMKELKAASSDFTEGGVGNIEIDTKIIGEETNPETERATLEEIKRLQELGDEVAADEVRAAEESRKKMQAIMHSAVTKSASIDDLREAAAHQASEEKLAEIEKRKKEEEEQKAAEEEKQRVREERRAMQKKQLEDALAKKNTAAAQEAAAQEDAVQEEVKPEEPKAEETPTEETVPAAEPAIEEPVLEEPSVPEIDIDATGVIVSDEQAFEDFGEFLDDGNKNDQ
ncbi:MAG: hypothetical protein J6Z43_07605 [Clostridiales bacterium]|nr:hypothetical protein [Clostridiales bacterium]